MKCATKYMQLALLINFGNLDMTMILSVGYFVNVVKSSD